MKVRAQLAMVMNLDKCLGCHTCSIPCKNVWTNRQGAEYIWYNNVETKPGIGYPKRWESRENWKGGWTVRNGGLELLAGGRSSKLLKIFHNPNLPSIDDYYEPWTYNYKDLIDSPSRKHQPSLRPKSLLTGENMEVQWGPNWEDDLAGAHVTGQEDVNFDGLQREAYLQFQQVFMLHLPRICEHCLNPACVASCPSGALYKRDEDGIVLVDQERCRGWRFCVSGCPYKKVYFNWKTGRSEKCLFCYPRIEAGLPTLCAESCVGRIRYLGIILYDSDRIESAAATIEDRDLHAAQLSMFLDPHDPGVMKEAERSGIPGNFLEAARHSPIYKLAVEWQLALPLHPEFRTLPMVWYIPPLSPVVRRMDEEDASPGEVLESMRIPLKYLANLLTAGDEAPVRRAMGRLMALRRTMRSERLNGTPDFGALNEADMSPEITREMLQLLALAKYRDRYVLPAGRAESLPAVFSKQGNTGYPPSCLD